MPERLYRTRLVQFVVRDEPLILTLEKKESKANALLYNPVGQFDSGRSGSGIIITEFFKSGTVYSGVSISTDMELLEYYNSMLNRARENSKAEKFRGELGRPFLGFGPDVGVNTLPLYLDQIVAAFILADIGSMEKEHHKKQK